MSKEVRVRIAPSPTGEPHVGTAYIALFNRCLARSRGGKFILRIEDTDRERSTPESEQAILDCLRWLGLTWDEGPDVGGPFGPYRQSERQGIYREHAGELIRNGWAYRCFCTREELDALRARQEKDKRPAVGYFAADSPCRNMPPSEAEERAARGEPHVIRLKVPGDTPDAEISFFDCTRGKNISRKCSEIDDQVLLKSDGFPTYHLANVVDDHLMGISTVIRGEEWIASTFKHVLLYRAFGWEVPEFYHLSLLRNPDRNKSKISKRKNPVSLRWFRAAGHVPGALLNFLALMGYSRTTEGRTEEEIRNIEIFSIDELVREFDVSRISVSGPAFDYEKLNALNDLYINRMDSGEFCSYLSSRVSFLMEYLGGLAPQVRERFRRFERELGAITDFLFRLTLSYRLEDFQKAGLSCDEAAKLLTAFRKKLRNDAEKIVTADHFKECMLKAREELSVESKALHMAVRLAVTGSGESLPLYESMSALGVYRCMSRLEEAAGFLSNHAKK
ncbi:MAG: glutamate--tRNA ligase [Candidatus Eremiobacteraeota bacterium]|nr:glutamate--tRNA ligase [Candidatus Eremiobacteraeota bacterium]